MKTYLYVFLLPSRYLPLPSGGIRVLPQQGERDQAVRSQERPVSNLGLRRRRPQQAVVVAVQEERGAALGRDREQQADEADGQAEPPHPGQVVVADEQAGPDDGGGDAGEEQEQVPLRVGEAGVEQQVLLGPPLDGLPRGEGGEEVEQADLADDADDEDVPEDVQDRV
ncbi:hypothetical protein PG993_004134 [Apiospora rasikravindrae]|uniref:Uncharacterized protein n=1 Tax=Apiospora rasikravindrae TaxID=990691 RepID=A0ABR1TBX9_9PEZI